MTTSVAVDGESACVRRLSRGMASDVFEVVRGGHSVAMKVLHRRAAPSDTRRFAREVEALASVRHPNVVRIERVLSDGFGPRALVMPLLSGSTLREVILAEGCLAPCAVIDLAIGVLGGLDALHARGIFHRDIKPANVFVGREHSEPHAAVRAIVLDLGAACAPSRVQTTGRHVIGSARYVAPEQILGGRVDARTDVWGVGLTMLEALTGRPAFGKDDPLETLEIDPLDAALRGPMRSLVRPFGDLLSRAIAKRPQRRFASALAMSEALESVIRSEIAA